MNSLKSTKQIILSHTLTYFNFLNLALAGLVILSGQYKNMLFMGVVIANSLIGIVQELRVKKVIDRLSVITATKAHRRTGNGLEEIPVEEIRVGDELYFTSGDQITADCSVLSSDGLEINESMLTGESVPVVKSPETLFYPVLLSQPAPAMPRQDRQAPITTLPSWLKKPELSAVRLPKCKIQSTALSAW